MADRDDLPPALADRDEPDRPQPGVDPEEARQMLESLQAPAKRSLPGLTKSGLVSFAMPSAENNPIAKGLHWVGEHIPTNPEGSFWHPSLANAVHGLVGANEHWTAGAPHVPDIAVPPGLPIRGGIAAEEAAPAAARIERAEGALPPALREKLAPGYSRDVGPHGDTIMGEMPQGVTVDNIVSARMPSQTRAVREPANANIGEEPPPTLARDWDTRGPDLTAIEGGLPQISKADYAAYLAMKNATTHRELMQAASPVMNNMRDQYGFTVMAPGFPKDPAIASHAISETSRAMSLLGLKGQRTYPPYGIYYGKPLGWFEDGYGGKSGLGVPYNVKAEDLAALIKKRLVDENSSSLLSDTGKAQLPGVMFEEGQPLGKPFTADAWHGTDRGLKGGRFSDEKIGDTWYNNDRFAGMHIEDPEGGVWLTNSPKEAGDYAKSAMRHNKGDPEQTGPNVIPAEVRFQNAYMHPAEDIANEGISSMPSLDELTKKGYDGAVIPRDAQWGDRPLPDTVMGKPGSELTQAEWRQYLEDNPLPLERGEGEHYVALRPGTVFSKLPPYEQLYSKTDKPGVLGAAVGSQQTKLMKAREILQILKDDGWEVTGSKGSHLQLTHPTKPGKVTLPGNHLNDTLPLGTTNSIWTQAGLKASKPGKQAAEMPAAPEVDTTTPQHAAPPNSNDWMFLNHNPATGKDYYYAHDHVMEVGPKPGAYTAHTLSEVETNPAFKPTQDKIHEWLSGEPTGSKTLTADTSQGWLSRLLFGDRRLKALNAAQSAEQYQALKRSYDLNRTSGLQAEGFLDYANGDVGKALARHDELMGDARHSADIDPGAREAIARKSQHWPEWGDTNPGLATAHVADMEFGEPWRQLVSSIEYPHPNAGPVMEHEQAVALARKQNPELAAHAEKANEAVQLALPQIEYGRTTAPLTKEQLMRDAIDRAEKTSAARSRGLPPQKPMPIFSDNAKGLVPGLVLEQPMSKQYLRVGDWHPSETSRNYANGTTENGVSVYELDPSGHPVLRGDSEWGAQDLADRLAGKDPKYLVTGEHVGYGGDGEPLLKKLQKIGPWPKSRSGAPQDEKRQILEENYGRRDRP